MKLGTNDIGSVYLGTNAVQKVYLGTNEVWSAVDPDAQAFFDRVTTAGGSLSTTEQDAILTLVADLKADGIWTKMKAIYPMVGASAAACAQNLKSSSFTGTFNGGVTYSSNGVLSNGTTGYMDTTLVPSSELSLNSTHLSYYSRTNNSGNYSEMGSNNGASNRLQMTIRFANTNYNAVSNGVSQFSYTSNTDAFWITNRISSSQIKTFKNGAVLNTNNINSQALNSLSIPILGTNNGSGVEQFSTRQCAFASIGDGLTDTEASNFYTAVQAFQTTLSRNV